MSAVMNARAAWGDALPDWISALAEECDRTSQSKAAARLERSDSLVSGVIRNRYPGDMQAVEEIVRGTLMSEHVDCPVLGKTGKHICRKWRARSRSFENVNSQHVTMYRACNRCPLNEPVAERQDTQKETTYD